TDCYPATTLIRGTNRIEDELHAVTVFKGRRIFNLGPAAAQCFTDRDGERSETSGPASLAHALGHVVLIDLHRPPRTRSGRRAPQLTRLFNHQRALRAVNLETVLILARLNHRDRRRARRTFRKRSITESKQEFRFIVSRHRTQPAAFFVRTLFDV